MGEAASYVSNLVEVHKELLRAYHSLEGNKKTAEGADGEVKYSANGDTEGKSIKEQIKNSLDVLSEMEPVASIQLRRMGNKTKAEIFSEVLHDVKSKGMTIDKKDFGIITLTEDDINRGLDYVNSDAEYSAYFAIHRVLKRGVVIGEHTDHKNRNMRTVTVGAPIILDGERCNVGIALKAIKGYRYKSLRVVLWDGSKFDAKKETKATTSRMTDVSTGESRDITLASNVSLSQGEADVKGSNLSGDVKYSFAGKSAKTADMSALERAESMERGKATAENILRETGWYRGIDGKWRFEISDDEAEFSRRGDLAFKKEHPDYGRYTELRDIKDKYYLGLEGGRELNAQEEAELAGLTETWGNVFRENGRVGEGAGVQRRLESYFDHEGLYEAYPELRNVKIKFVDDLGDNGSFDAINGEIRLKGNRSDAETKKTLIHEVQHWIQQKEGFTGGSNSEYWERNGVGNKEASKLYRNTAGEIEARDASARMNMTEAERRESMPHRGDGNTVFADDSMISFDEDNKKTAEGAVDSNAQNDIIDLQVLEKLKALKGLRGIKYNDGKAIKIPNNDMATLRHKYATESGYAIRTEGLLDAVSCFGQMGKKHYFYVFYKGEDYRVAPIFRLDYEYIDRYIQEIKEINEELGYSGEEFVNEAKRISSYLARNRSVGQGSSVNDDIAADGKGIHGIVEVHTNEGRLHNGASGEKNVERRQFSSGVSDGDNEGNGNRGRIKFSMPAPGSQAQYEDRAYKLERDMRSAIEEKLGAKLSDESLQAVQGVADSIAKGDEARIRASLVKLFAFKNKEWNNWWHILVLRTCFLSVKHKKHGRREQL